MITSDIEYGEIFRQEILKYKNFIEQTNKDTTGWIFYETIYKISEIKKNDNDIYIYNVYCIGDNKYEPSKSNVNKLKKINWNMNTEKIKKDFLEYDDKMISNYVYPHYNPLDKKIKLKNFNILLKK